MRDFFRFFAPAWSGPRVTVKAIDTHAREQTKVVLVPNNRGPGLAAPYGMFIELAHSKYGVNRFFKTAPAHALPLRPTLKGVNKQVNNPRVQALSPGLTSQLSVNSSKLSAIANKPYFPASR